MFYLAGDIEWYSFAPFLMECRVYRQRSRDMTVARGRLCTRLAPTSNISPRTNALCENFLSSLIMSCRQTVMYLFSIARLSHHPIEGRDLSNVFNGQCVVQAEYEYRYGRQAFQIPYARLVWLLEEEDPGYSQTTDNRRYVDEPNCEKRGDPFFD